MTPRDIHDIIDDILNVLDKYEEKIFILSNLVLDMSVVIFKEEEFPSKEHEEIRKKLKYLSSF